MSGVGVGQMNAREDLIPVHAALSILRPSFSSRPFFDSDPTRPFGPETETAIMHFRQFAEEAQSGEIRPGDRTYLMLSEATSNEIERGPGTALPHLTFDGKPLCRAAPHGGTDPGSAG